MPRDVARLSGRTFDLLVIGGGIYGLTIAADAAQRGLAVALVERDDYGSGSTFNHLRTIHGGLRDYIRHGESGWIVNPLDSTHLADGLHNVMQSYQTVIRMGRSHHAEDRAFFAPERTAAGFSAIYRELGRMKSD